MRIVGLVGQSGTGKSTIARHLVKNGASHIDADAIAHEVLRSGEKVHERVRARFGPNVFTGTDIDRDALARAVFNDAEALRALNRIVHPLIIKACVDRLREFEQAGVELVVIDAALLLEVPLPFTIDLTIGLRCGRDEQIRRLMKQGGKSEKEIIARLDSQTRIEASLDRADVVLDTARPQPVVLNDIDNIVRVLLDHPSK